MKPTTEEKLALAARINIACSSIRQDSRNLGDVAVLAFTTGALSAMAEDPFDNYDHETLKHLVKHIETACARTLQ